MSNASRIESVAVTGMSLGGKVLGRNTFSLTSRDRLLRRLGGVHSHCFTAASSRHGDRLVRRFRRVSGRLNNNMTSSENQRVTSFRPRSSAISRANRTPFFSPSLVFNASTFSIIVNGPPCIRLRGVGGRHVTCRSLKCQSCGGANSLCRLFCRHKLRLLSNRNILGCVASGG